MSGSEDRRPDRRAAARWCVRRAWKHAVTAGRYAAEATAHLAGLPASVTHRLGDGATLAAFSCALDFEPAEVRRQVGWECAHASVTTVRTGVPLAVPRMWCGCQMQPVFADARNKAL
jgi:hypothetical protein